MAALNRPAEARLILLEALVEVQSVHALPLALDALAVLAAVQLQSDAYSTAIFRSVLYILAHPAATWETRARARRLLDVVGTPQATASDSGESSIKATLETLAGELTGAEIRHLLSTGLQGTA